MAFWTVLLVTPLPLLMSWSDEIWRLHEMPKMVPGATLGNRRWKYE